MKRTCPNFLLFIVLFQSLFWSVSTIAEESATIDWSTLLWKTRVIGDGIHIETAKFPGSRFLAVKSSMRVNARLTDIANLLLLRDGCHEGLSECHQVKKVKMQDEQNYFQYVVSKFPWPFRKRDMFLQIKVEQTPQGIITIAGHSFPDEYPLDKRFVRIRNMDVLWRLSPQGQGDVLVEHYIHSHPQGIIPAWAFNNAVEMVPIDTLKNIRRLLQLPKYQQRYLAFISEAGNS